MKKFIILASLAIAVFSLAPYHTVAVPVSPTQAPKALNLVEPLGGTTTGAATTGKYLAARRQNS